jgi:hypothetical protein
VSDSCVTPIQQFQLYHGENKLIFNEMQDIFNYISITLGVHEVKELPKLAGQIVTKRCHMTSLRHHI